MARYLEFGVILTVLCVQLFVVMSSKNNRPYDPSKLRVVSIEVSPYLKHIGRYDGQSHYTGYIKELLDAIMAQLGIRYEMYMVPDGQFGYLQDKTTWNGMIKELLDNNADIAAAPLHRTYTRATVVHFTRSILNVSATMLIKKPYNGIPDVQSLEDLKKFPDLHVGALKTGTIRRAFLTSTNPTYIDLWHRISSKRLTSSNAEGINQVKMSKGKYVYILPSDIAEYNAGEKPCDLMAVGHFFQRELAFAVQKNSELLHRINKALIRLENSGYMHNLYKRWWLENRPCSKFTYSVKTEYLKTESVSCKTTTVSKVLVLFSLIVLTVLNIWEVNIFS